MRAIIPAAGFGSRLKPHTITRPKVLLNVGGKPMISHIIEKLLTEGITKATFIVGYLGEQVEEYVKQYHPYLQSDFVYQEKLEGLGHAIWMAIPTFDEDELFIVLGDTIFEVELKSVFEKKVSSLGVKTVEDPSRFGVAVLDENQYITKLIEKPTTPISKLALVGMYYINKKQDLIDALNELVEKDIRTKGELQLTDALQIMIDKGHKFITFQVDGWYDCGKKETILETNRFLLEKNYNTQIPKSCVIIPPVYISEDAQIENSVIGPYTTISRGCIIKNAVIKNSIVRTGAHVEDILLKDSLIGPNAFIKGNYRIINAGDNTEIEFS
ncbi:MAG TPA: sugar phosphate nucleotidyltransferase [Ignavibacteriales bacterium]|nr:sugar phosphate nucleotidyltransferase [Ignavibacteriales bacterium]HOL82176.1 sugar phosphate nucleotidyltransferase [Ignavibacteriales bacterium]HOM65756.1 sugar phosphate nucleotidyltransferase [Ignavibacteriales bacterium]HPD67611.1 sugar phosphate nucleotidyltransferase [Ignavibacteriales bacterium]HPP34304.1 sugar phosphate nucleotidyltransferase [Ignavibacteriales bacterium]